MPKFHILGNRNRSEFAEIVSRCQTDGAHEVSVERADFVLLLREFPGQYTRDDVDRIKRQAPVTPILSLEGSWCEGEARTGERLVGTHSVLWYDFLVEWPLELRAWRAGKPTIWSQPETAGPDTLALADLSRGIEFSLLPQKRVIYSEDFAFFALLRDLFPWPETWRAPTSTEIEPDWLWFDFPDLSEATKRLFLDFRKRFSPIPTLAFVEFPRIDEWRWLKEQGIEGIFPKPFRINDLKNLLAEKRGWNEPFPN